MKILLSSIAAILLFSFCGVSQEPVPVIDAKQMSADMSNDSIVILDVRSPEEFAEGHIPGAINIDYRNENFSSALDSLDKGRQYNVYCRSGGRSTNASSIMHKKGFNVKNYEGSMIDWEEKGMPVER